MAKWTHSNWDYVLSRAAIPALTAIGIKMVADARARVPVNTGRLKGSLTWSVQSDRSRVDAPAIGADAVSTPSDKWTAYVGTNVNYAAHVEYGTRRSRSQPYLRPAMDSNRGWANQRFKNELHEAILKHGQ